MKKLTETKYKSMCTREEKGEKLTNAEKLSVLIYLGYSESEAREMLFLNSKIYGKPDNSDIITIV